MQIEGTQNVNDLEFIRQQTAVVVTEGAHTR